MNDGQDGFKTQLHWKLDQLKNEIMQTQAEIQRMTDQVSQKQAQVDHVLKLLEAEGDVIDKTELDGVIPVSLAEVAAKVLKDHGVPMHYKKLTAAIQSKGHKVPGQNPDASVIALLHRKKDVFARTDQGIWGLKVWNTTVQHAAPARRKKAKRRYKRKTS